MPLKEIRLDEELWKNMKEDIREILVGDILQSGIARIKPKQRLPSAGFSKHEESDELSIVLSGKLKFCTDTEELILEHGSLLLNPKGTPHFVENIGNEEARVLWVLAPKIKLQK